MNMIIPKRAGSNPLPPYEKPFLEPVITPTAPIKKVVVEVKLRR